MEESALNMLLHQMRRKLFKTMQQRLQNNATQKCTLHMHTIQSMRINGVTVTYNMCCTVCVVAKPLTAFHRVCKLITNQAFLI